MLQYFIKQTYTMAAMASFSMVVKVMNLTGLLDAELSEYPPPEAVLTPWVFLTMHLTLTDLQSSFNTRKISSTIWLR